MHHCNFLYKINKINNPILHFKNKIENHRTINKDFFSLGAWTWVVFAQVHYSNHNVMGKFALKPKM